MKGPSGRGIGWGSTSLLGGCTMCGPSRRKAVRVHVTSRVENSEVALYKFWECMVGNCTIGYGYSFHPGPDAGFCGCVISKHRRISFLPCLLPVVLDWATAQGFHNACAPIITETKTSYAFFSRAHSHIYAIQDLHLLHPP